MTSGKKPELIPEKMRLRTKFDSLVSIVIPTYNRAHLLSRAIQSVLNQTYSNFELLVVDDFSTDCTESVVKGFHDNRIRYIRHKKTQGAATARNNGIKATKGEYIAFQDSDDEWLPTKLEKQVSAFNSAPSDLGVVYTSFWLIDNGKKTLVPSSHVKQTEGKIHDELLKTNFVSTPTVVVRKECFEKVGMFANIPRFQDWELWLRISKYYSFKHIREPLVNSYRQPDSISRKIDALVLARKYILFRYYDAISEKPKILAKHYSDIGIFLCSKGNIKAGRKYFFKAVSANPSNAKLLLRTIASIFGSTIYNKYDKLYYMLREHAT